MKEKLLSQFGKRVRELRKSRHLSQVDLAEKCGLHRNYIGMIERGERNPSLINIYKISQAFDIELSELLKIENGI